MPNLRRLLSRRRVLAVLGIAALLFGLAMLHPYPRQSLFGPTIRGKPWCVWEAEVRYFVHHEEYEKSYSAKMLRWAGVKHEEISRRELLGRKDMLPLLLDMAEDTDRDVRAICLESLSFYEDVQGESALPVLYRRLNDDDSRCRVSAALAVWRVNRDKRVVDVIKHELDNYQSSVSHDTFGLLDNVCSDEPEIFSILVPYARNPNKDVRHMIMCVAVRAEQKLGLSVLIDGLSDPESEVRMTAAGSLIYGAPGREITIPALERCLKDSNRNVRRTAAEALVAIDPVRFQHLKAKSK